MVSNPHLDTIQAIWKGSHNPILRGLTITMVHNQLVVSNIFNFHPYLGKIPNLISIFQMCWNHQLDNHLQAGDEPPRIWRKIRWRNFFPQLQAHNAQDWHGWTALHAAAAHGKKVGAESAHGFWRLTFGSGWVEVEDGVQVCKLGQLLKDFRKSCVWCENETHEWNDSEVHVLIWSSYSDVTRPGPPKGS